MQIGVIYPRAPRPDLHGGDNRLVQLMGLMTALGHEITLFVHHLRDRQVESRWPLHAISPNTISQLSTLHHFDVLWISYYDLALLYTKKGRAAHLADYFILDTVDAHSLREAREAILYADARKRSSAEETRRKEQTAYEHTDAIVAVSEPDALYISGQLVRHRPIYIVGNVHSVGAPVTFESGPRPEIAFVGAYGHAPNVDAVMYFVHSILPRVLLSVPSVRFIVVGSQAELLSSRLPDTEHIAMIGHVESVERYLSHCRVFVAPLRFGAGVKGKVGQAMAIGLPVVTTSVGAEGLKVQSGHQILLRDDAASFADAVVDVCVDVGLWYHLSRASMQHVDENFGPAAVIERLSHVLSRVNV